MKFRTTVVQLAWASFVFLCFIFLLLLLLHELGGFRRRHVHYWEEFIELGHLFRFRFLVPFSLFLLLYGTLRSAFIELASHNIGYTEAQKVEASHDGILDHLFFIHLEVHQEHGCAQESHAGHDCRPIIEVAEKLRIRFHFLSYCNHFIFI